MDFSLEQRKAYALDLLNNPLLGDILEGMERDVLAGWRAAQNTDAREQAWYDTRAIQKLRSAIESALVKAQEAENETPEE